MQAITLAIGTSSQLVLGPGAGGVLIQADPGNTQDIYLGGQSVTADSSGTGGIRLQAGTVLPAIIPGDDRLFAVAPSGSQLLRIIYQGDDASLGMG